MQTPATRLRRSPLGRWSRALHEGSIVRGLPSSCRPDRVGRRAPVTGHPSVLPGDGGVRAPGVDVPSGPRTGGASASGFLAPVHGALGSNGHRPSTAYVFEGGGALQTALEQDLRALRHAIALDTLETLVGLRAQGALDRVVLITDRPDLAAAVAPGVEVEDSTPGAGATFHFGRALAHLLARDRPGTALVMGGAAGPLLTADDFRRFLQLAEENPGAVIQNNPQSPDVVAFSPAWAASTLDLPDSDNALGHALTGGGFRRLLIENSARVNFDVDTPADAALLAGEAAAGPRTRLTASTLAWTGPLRRRLDAVVGILAGESQELALFGRVGPPITGYLNIHLRCRLRMFSEERGMRALGRVAAGTVVSFVGRLCDAVGPVAFFDLLRGCADAVLFDSRVLMAHWKQPLSEADRFHSDIGAVGAIADPRLAAFTEAAWASDTPIVLGGHTLVYGGLWLLAERAIRLRSDAQQ